MAKEYVVQGATLKCMYGSTTVKLNIPISSGIFMNNLAAANMLNAIPFFNILPFGTCTSPLYPAPSKTGPCMAGIIPIWQLPKTKAIFTYAPAINTDCFCVCALTGMIEIQDSGQSGSAAKGQADIDKFSDTEQKSVSISEETAKLTKLVIGTDTIRLQKRMQESLTGGSDKENPPSVGFTGNLRGEAVTLSGVEETTFHYVKCDRNEFAEKRKKFNSSARKNFMKNLGENSNQLAAAGFSEDEIEKMKAGYVPKGWQVHHIIPLDDGGTNEEENLVLIKNDPYHIVVTNHQNSILRQWRVEGTTSGDVQWPVIPQPIYPASG